MPHHHPSNPNPTPNTHIFLVQRRTYSCLTFWVLTQQILGCYTSSEAAIQRVKAEIRKLHSVNKNININVSNQAETGVEFRKGGLDARMQGECYREVAEWSDERLGKKKVELGVLRMEVRGCFDGDDEEVKVDLDLDVVADDTVDVDVEMNVGDDTLVDVDGQLKSDGALPEVELQDDESKLPAGGEAERPYTTETYFRGFHAMIEKLHVHDLDQQSNPVVWPQKRVLSQGCREGTRLGNGNSAALGALPTMATKKLKVQATEVKIAAPALARASKKRGRALEPEVGDEKSGIRLVVPAAKRPRAGAAGFGRPAWR